jgi:hypothetical protein
MTLRGAEGQIFLKELKISRLSFQVFRQEMLKIHFLPMLKVLKMKISTRILTRNLYHMTQIRLKI